MRRLLTTGVHEGKTIRLANIEFVDGKADFTMSDSDWEGTLKYYNRSFQCVEGTYGSDHDQVHEDAGPVQERDSGVPEERGSSEEAPVHDGTDADAPTRDQGLPPVGHGSTSPDLAKLSEIVHGLDTAEDELWTVDDLPSLSAVSALYPESPISRADIETAVGEYRRSPTIEE